MITIDLQDDDASRTKKTNRLDEKTGRQHQRSLDSADAKSRDQFPPQNKSGLIASILRLFGYKE